MRNIVPQHQEVIGYHWVVLSSHWHHVDRLVFTEPEQSET
jgi:hypothetical protein